ncbi:YjcZ family sporulation protein [Alkalihalophilus marmarensis]|jgi:uncharacterized protein (TIGR01732 family)|uniref:Sporulation protein YjcZ n=1 Tax=Alkalihalophilus marmarensis DSM 21297 TaxID=1188261 RepID=U6SQZ3_9BACI|nr:YjcZ family sporulation protein [Alkalihalophilus marmarensis]ERN53066.1 hypothetical protein A33I_13255 [Alkalihalophilus marmarensis DSM 21297]MCM3488926.1 YjcZ family sporulation protein [Alkalihalophilus marmarensis]
MYGYSYGGQGCYDPCGYGYGAPVAGYAGGGCGKGFALIVVLFILLIIVGASRFGHGGHCC